MNEVFIKKINELGQYNNKLTTLADDLEVMYFNINEGFVIGILSIDTVAKQEEESKDIVGNPKVLCLSI